VKITTVPCVILTYENGEMEKFEGDNVSEWIMEQIINNSPQNHTQVFQEPEMYTPIDDIEEQIPIQQQQIPIQQQQTILEDLEDESSIQRNKSIQELAAEMSAARDSSFDSKAYGTELQSQMTIPIQQHPTGNTQRPVSTANMAAQMAQGRESMELPIHQQKDQMVAQHMKNVLS
jgi:hypothetical protein